MLLCAKVRRWLAGQYINRLNEFVKHCAPADRDIHISFISAFNRMKLEQHELCADFAIACIECNMSGPMASSGISNFIKVADISSMTACKKKTMIELNHSIMSFHKFIDQLHLPELSFIAMKGKIDCTLVRLFIEKTLPEGYKDYNMYHVLRACADEALELVESKTDVQNPWKETEFPPKKPNASTSSQPAILSGLIEYDDDANATGMNKLTLASQGFVAGSMVQIIDDEGQT